MEKAWKEYSCWCGENLPEDLREELENIKENKEEILDRFCRHITFGTSGLRGRMGVGTSRMNSVVIRRATMGIADYVLGRRSHPAIAISYDTRMHSREYAEVVADTLSRRGIDTWMMACPQPVPLLSFTVRHMGLSGGIMITASHNPKEYNGYKVYDHFGNQIDDRKARLLEGLIEEHGYFEVPPLGLGTRGNRFTVPEEVIETYRQNISSRAVWWSPDEAACREAAAELSVIYTPLNGTGYDHVPEILHRLGVKDLTIVESQTCWDGQFATCPSPNPENRKAYGEAEKLAFDKIRRGEKPADLIIATDPDCDRMGVMVYHRGEYVLLSGNQTGELFFDFLCDSLGGPRDENLKGKWVYKSLVSSPLVDLMGKARGISVGNTLTGFKNIALQMERLCEDGREDDFLFGFEESFGYLYGTYTRDKDGVMAAQLAVLAAARCRAKGITLLDQLDRMHRRYGYVETRAAALHFHRERDRESMNKIMESLFEGALCMLNGQPVEADRSCEKDNVFQGRLGRYRLVVRPSGTELKLKSYVFAEGNSQEEASDAADSILKALQAWLAEAVKE